MAAWASCHARRGATTAASAASAAAAATTSAPSNCLRVVHELRQEPRRQRVKQRRRPDGDCVEYHHSNPAVRTTRMWPRGGGSDAAPPPPPSPLPIPPPRHFPQLLARVGIGQQPRRPRPVPHCRWRRAMTGHSRVCRARRGTSCPYRGRSPPPAGGRLSSSTAVPSRRPSPTQPPASSPPPQRHRSRPPPPHTRNPRRHRRYRRAMGGQRQGGHRDKER